MKKLWLTLGFIAVLSVFLVFVLASRPPEPEYHGVKLTALLEGLDDTGLSVPGEDPASEIRQIGTNAVPFLVHMLQAKDSYFKRKWMDLLGRQDWVYFDSLRDDEKHSLALEGLVVLGPDAKAAGEPAVPVLVKCLKDSDSTVRQNAALVLRQIAEDPDVVVPALITNLNDADANVRMVTVIALGSYGERAKPAVPKILKIIQENNGNLIYATPLDAALARIDPEAAAKLTGQ